MIAPRRLFEGHRDRLAHLIRCLTLESRPRAQTATLAAIGFGWVPVCLSVVVGGLLFALAAPHAAAQGCAMCYQTAAASGEQTRAALRHGILILLLPAVGIFLGICALIYRRSNVAR